MVETLREFIERRFRELNEIEAPLRAKLDEIERERKELERAAKIAGYGNENVDTTNKIDSQKTIKQAVLEILENKPNGLTATEILKELKIQMNMAYARTSLSPQLSRLKRDRKIKQDGIVWSLAQADKK